MVKVITYGTFDLLHYGHIRLLERAKELGDYLIVGVTADDFDKKRGKINVQQSLMERIEAVKAAGIADEVIVEEYEGQKIDDIRKYGVDIFTVGSDWVGQFDYLDEYCKVVYLPRTLGVSSTELRSDRNVIRVGLVGEKDAGLTALAKFVREAGYINGVHLSTLFSPSLEESGYEGIEQVGSYDELLERVDAVYIASHPKEHYEQVKKAIQAGKHVLCESPVALSERACWELIDLAEERGCILMDGIKTAYATAYERLILMVKSGAIGEVVSVDATCTSIRKFREDRLDRQWNTLCEWGPPALLPVFQILGTNYRRAEIVTKTLAGRLDFDLFTRVSFTYDRAVASIKVGKGVKSEGELIISGTEGYLYVPAPWWKTDYFEIRYENMAENKRCFFQLDGEGIRYEIAAFARAIRIGKGTGNVAKKVSAAIGGLLEQFDSGWDVIYI